MKVYRAFAISVLNKGEINLSIYLEKVGNDYYGDIADREENVKKHKEFMIESASDVANLPGLSQCAPGSIATDAKVTLVYRLSVSGVWEAM